MPPLTRAGQTGRGNDDQATTGNGQEEGWLTQVARILQLANPALMAEEAIVRAMGLVSISNQTPRRETEKIPRDVSSAIAHIKKLSDSNWHTWEPTFIDCLQRVHNAKEILYGTVAPGNEEYDEDLDKALVGLIHACCDNSPDSRIDTYTVRGADEGVQLGSTLYAKLKKTLTLNDAVKRAGLQDRIHTVRLHNRDVVKLGKELDSIWNDVARLGRHFDEDLKKSTLYHCTAQDWFYANSVDALKTAKPDSIGGDKRSACDTWIIDSGLIENGARVIFDEFGTTIKQNDGTHIQYRRNRKQSCFEVRGQALALELEETLNDVPEDNQNTGNQNSTSKEDKDSYLWHERFGHPGRDKTRQIRKHYLGTNERMEQESRHCSACSQGKQTRAQMGPSESRRAEAPLELVHVDLMTDFKGHANYHYALAAVDDFSSLIYVEPLCTKSAALSALRRWITRMEQATDRKLKTLRSDNGGEWSSQGAEDWQVHEGFKWQKTVPGVSAQNGWAERAISHQVHSARGLLRNHGTQIGPTTKDQQGKYGARAKPAIMVGYNDEHKAWKFCNPDQPVSIQWSNSATFHEDKGWSDRQQKVYKPTTAVEVEEENVTSVTTAEEETRSEAAVEDLLPVMDSAMSAGIRGMIKGGALCHLDEVGVTPINDEVTLGLLDHKEQEKQC
ncbi:related to retrotransposon protein [Ustilago sp. UG-2017b]|nr:related to retrotransposon protein [Ustilago sp. UG-2017b]